MRLINTRTLLFEEFIGNSIPKYAILSHTWGEEEVLFKDMSDPLRNMKKGFWKIQMTCKTASEDGLQYAWVDTCAIDKSSSAELTEAINSMYRWYQRATICYAFLEDLPASSSLEHILPRCRWFTRGWTLQELIAPDKLYFYDQEWTCRGSKEDHARSISAITGIGSDILLHSTRLSSVAVAQKMSWAANRQTTRIEDIAYSLLGIFDVNMPLLYGEEGKAFRRLQEEIIRSTSDFSIFAWKLPQDATKPIERKGRFVCGILADTPHAFTGCNSVTKVAGTDVRELSISNLGVKTKVRLFLERPISRLVLPLDCSRSSRTLLGVRLKQYGPEQYVREDPWNLVEDTESTFDRPGHFRERSFLTQLPEMELPLDSKLLDMSSFLHTRRWSVLHIRSPPETRLFDLRPLERFDLEDFLFFLPKNSRLGASLMKLEFQSSPGGPYHACTFWATYWNTLGNQRMQYSLVDSTRYSTALTNVQSRSADVSYDSREVVNDLIINGVPRTTAVVFKLPGKREYFSISCSASLVRDVEICQREFWRVNFDTKVFQAKRTPEISQRHWELYD
jgi:hypothetical protein